MTGQNVVKLYSCCTQTVFQNVQMRRLAIDLTDSIVKKAVVHVNHRKK
jgi:hypothetical protein